MDNLIAHPSPEESGEDEVEVNLNVRSATAAKFESRFAYIASANKWIRDELVRQIPAAEGGESSGADIQEIHAGTEYPTLPTEVDAQQHFSTQYNQIASETARRRQEGRVEKETAAAFHCGLKELADMAPVRKNFKALPVGRIAFIVDVRDIPADVLKMTRLPAPGKYVRTSFDQNLAGLDQKPWSLPGAPTEDYFNYGLDEDCFLHYARRQRELRVALSKYALMPAEDGSNATLADGRLDLDAIERFDKNGFSVDRAAFDLVDITGHAGRGRGVLPLAVASNVGSGEKQNGDPLLSESPSSEPSSPYAPAKIRVGAMLAMTSYFCQGMNRARINGACRQCAFPSHGRVISARGDLAGPCRSEFQACNAYMGSEIGWFFGSGAFGLGYYRDYYPECLEALRVATTQTAESMLRQQGKPNINDGNGDEREGNERARENTEVKIKGSYASVARGASLAVQYEHAGCEARGALLFKTTSSWFSNEHTALQTRLSPLSRSCGEALGKFSRSSDRKRQRKLNGAALAVK